MQQNKRRGQYICSITGDVGSIYEAKQGKRAVYMQGMWACNNITPPYISMGLSMLLLLHALIEQVVSLKMLRTAGFESSEPLFLLRLMGVWVQSLHR